MQNNTEEIFDLNAFGLFLIADEGHSCLAFCRKDKPEEDPVIYEDIEEEIPQFAKDVAESAVDEPVFFHPGKMPIPKKEAPEQSIHPMHSQFEVGHSLENYASFVRACCQLEEYKPALVRLENGIAKLLFVQEPHFPSPQEQMDHIESLLAATFNKELASNSTEVRHG